MWPTFHRLKQSDRRNRLGIRNRMVATQCNLYNGFHSAIILFRFRIYLHLLSNLYIVSTIHTMCLVEPAMYCYRVPSLYARVQTTGRIRGRPYSTQLTPNQLTALDNWIASPGKLVLSDTVSPGHLSDLYITLPSRDGTRKPYEEPQHSQPVPYGHHLVFFHPRTPESMLRTDGTDPVLCPLSPFTRRMWAGGRFEWNNANPLLVGSKATATSSIASVIRKGFENGKPMVFVNQKVEIVKEGSTEPSVTEIRSHVYLPQSSRPSGKPREGVIVVSWG